MECQYPLQTTLGSLGNDNDDGRENVAKKTNLRPFKLYRVYSSPLNLSNVGISPGVEFFCSFKKRKENSRQTLLLTLSLLSPSTFRKLRI